MTDTGWDRLRRKSEAVPRVEGQPGWHGLKLDVPPAALEPCSVASEFAAKLQDILLVPLGDAPTRGQIAQAKYLLQEQWQLWRKNAPGNHGASLSMLRGHVCVDAIYHATYEQLNMLEFTLRPPAHLITDYEELVRSSGEDARQTIDGIVIADEVVGE